MTRRNTNGIALANRLADGLNNGGGHAPRRRHASPAEIDLMGRLADDLASGGVDVFLANEREWRGTPLAAFMSGLSLDPEPPSLNAVAIFSKWNGKPAPSVPVAASTPEHSPAITDLDPAEIWARWNGTNSRQQANAGA